MLFYMALGQSSFVLFQLQSCLEKTNGSNICLLIFSWIYFSYWRDIRFNIWSYFFHIHIRFISENFNIHTLLVTSIVTSILKTLYSIKTSSLAGLLWSISIYWNDLVVFVRTLSLHAKLCEYQEDFNALLRKKSHNWKEVNYCCVFDLPAKVCNNGLICGCGWVNTDESTNLLHLAGLP